MVLHALVEGMVLEVHVTGNTPEMNPLPLVELYTQFGSQVRTYEVAVFHI